LKSDLISLHKYLVELQEWINPFLSVHLRRFEVLGQRRVVIMNGAA